MKLFVTVMIARLIVKIFDKNKTKKEVFTSTNAGVKDPAAFNLR